MTAGKLFDILGDVDENKVTEAEQLAQKPARPRWRRWAALAACLVLVLVGAGTLLRGDPAGGGGGVMGNGGLFGGGDASLLAPHREDFTPDLEPGADALGPEVLKVYWLQSNEWFLSKQLTDFSQTVTTQVQYILPGEQVSGTGARGPGYLIYCLDEDGQLQESGSAMADQDAELPSGLVGLTHEIIQEDIGDVPYDDYIVTVSHRLYTAFVWVRSEEDFFLTYPSRPEFVGLENRGQYSLKEIQDILTRQYQREQSGEEGESNGAWPEGIDPIMASVAVFPKDTTTIYDVEDATITELTEAEAYRFEPLGAYLPKELPEGWSFDYAMLYDTTMKDGTKYYMLRVEYFRPNGLTEPSIIDGETGEELGGGPDGDHFLLFPMNYDPGQKYKALDADQITVRDIETKGGGVFHVSYGDVYMGISSNNYVSAEDILAMIQADLS